MNTIIKELFLNCRQIIALCDESFVSNNCNQKPLIFKDIFIHFENHCEISAGEADSFRPVTI